jgi:hypothetical protein
MHGHVAASSCIFIVARPTISKSMTLRRHSEKQEPDDTGFPHNTTFASCAPFRDLGSYMSCRMIEDRRAEAFACRGSTLYYSFGFHWRHLVSVGP